MAETLRRHVGALHWVGPLKEQYAWYFKAKQLASMLATKQRRLRDREPRILQGYARQAAARLAPQDIDLVFSPSTLPIAYLECKQPTFFWTDATFAQMPGFYLDSAVVTESSIRDGDAAERAALERCRLAIYSSEWAAQGAITNYLVNPSKVKVVPFGANLESRRTYAEMRQTIGHRPSNCCRLLFTGVDWTRKGGDIALAIAERLNVEGLRTELTVIGDEPKIHGSLPAFVESVGYLDQNTATDRARLEAYYAKSHFFVLPSRADCSPIVLAEASAFALPCVASDVGGISTIVREGKNGRTFSPGTDIADYCSYIRGFMDQRSAYEDLCRSSFNEYAQRLNWNSAGRTVRKLIDESI
jgi:glycosyltransferase involved in cell wall biosynthesis